MSKSDKIIRVGDRVRVVNPRRFVRCGYKLSKEDGIKEVLGEETKTETLGPLFRGEPVHANEPKIHEFLRSIGIEKWRERDYRNLVDQLGYMMVYTKGFGGRQRELFFDNDIDHFHGKDFNVVEIKFVRTGEYYAPAGGREYDGEYWYEPGGLMEAKTHKVLGLNWYMGNGLDMLAADVEKLL